MSLQKNTEGCFRDLWERVYGKSITEEDALAYEERLVRFVKFVVDLEHKERAPP